MTERISEYKLVDTVDKTVSSSCTRKIALVTGASRGIGASVAKQLGQAGVDVAINYRSKAPRAEEVSQELIAMGRRAILLQADITDPEQNAKMFRQIDDVWGYLDILVLNASGGLEQDKDPGYAMQLNLHAQVDLTNRALTMMRPGSQIVFVTSHLAHFHGTQAGFGAYDGVAESKRAGEDALREMLPILDSKGIRMVVVSGDLIDGTITPKLLERQSRGIIEARRQAVGALPTVDEFAAVIVRAALDREITSGETLFVGSTEPS
jgi:NAD(P)-dependent dehydrogenase (short-subunit alcohol dehydrogenase family)